MAAALAALITTIAYALPATAQPTYPSKPIRFILPNAPGGSNDVVARLVGEKLTASWDQPVVIDSRPGGNNVIAAEALLKSTPIMRPMPRIKVTIPRLTMAVEFILTGDSL